MCVCVCVCGGGVRIPCPPLDRRMFRQSNIHFYCSVVIPPAFLAFFLFVFSFVRSLVSSFVLPLRQRFG